MQVNLYLLRKNALNAIKFFTNLMGITKMVYGFALLNALQTDKKLKKCSLNGVIASYKFELKIR